MGSKWGLAFREAARVLAARRRREEGEEEAALDEAGFTLIELMVVLLIMGILMAIAIPTFLGAASGAHNTAAQSDLTNAMTSAKSVFATNGSYTTTTKAITALKKAEPEMSFATAISTTAAGSTHIAVLVATTGSVLVLASYAKTTKTCWLAADNESSTPTTINTIATTPPGINYGMHKETTAAACKATIAPTAWTRSYPKT